MGMHFPLGGPLPLKDVESKDTLEEPGWAYPRGLQTGGAKNAAGHLSLGHRRWGSSFQGQHFCPSTPFLSEPTQHYTRKHRSLVHAVGLTVSYTAKSQGYRQMWSWDLQS